MRGLGLILYGVEGIGKTSLALEFPKPLRCISVRESGYDDLKDIGVVPQGCENVTVASFNEFLTELRQSTDVKTIVIDSLSGVAQYVNDEILTSVYRGYDNPLQAFGSFSEGSRIHAPIWMEKIENVATILRNKGVNVILIGHTRIETSKNIVSDDYKSAGMDMDKWPKAVLTKWAQAVLFMTLDFKVRITQQWKGKTTEAKAAGNLEDEAERIIYCSKNPSHDAKNRLNLPPFIQMGKTPRETYEAFVSKLPPNFQEVLL